MDRIPFPIVLGKLTALPDPLAGFGKTEGQRMGKQEKGTSEGEKGR